MNRTKMAIKLHKELKGKLEIHSKSKINTNNLSLLYTPGVAAPCLEIAKDKSRVYDYTWKQNTIAIVTDGTAVLGLGDIGPEAALPVMEGKAILFKEFGGVNTIPICLNTKEAKEIINIIIKIAPGFGGINLEDISAPRCFEIEEALIKALDIPVFHDDQHGTAIVAYAGLINALKITKKNISQVKIVINGAGAAGIAISKFLLFNGAKHILLCDREGIIYRGREENMNFAKEEISKITNQERLNGDLKKALKNADIFIGVSTKNILTVEMIKSMKCDPIIFALANPDPEILPEVAKKAGAKIVATGRSDFPNQINNLLAFPGIFKGALEMKAKRITMEMKKAASLAIADMVPKNKLSTHYLIPEATNKKVADGVAHAVKKYSR